MLRSKCVKPLSMARGSSEVFRAFTLGLKGSVSIRNMAAKTAKTAMKTGLALSTVCKGILQLGHTKPPDSAEFSAVFVLPQHTGHDCISAECYHVRRALVAKLFDFESASS